MSQRLIAVLLFLIFTSPFAQSKEASDNLATIRGQLKCEIKNRSCSLLFHPKSIGESNFTLEDAQGISIYTPQLDGAYVEVSGKEEGQKIIAFGVKLAAPPYDILAGGRN
jgi:hypothetical protein